MRPHSEAEWGKSKELFYCGDASWSVALLSLLGRIFARGRLRLLLPALDAVDHSLAVDTPTRTGEEPLTWLANRMEWLHCVLLFLFVRRLTQVIA